MRSAETILRDAGVPEAWIMPVTINAVKNAKKEVIEECAERAKSWAYPTEDSTLIKHEVDKQSILSLIDELK